MPLPRGIAAHPRTLLVRAGGLGDVLLLRPAIGAARARGGCVWLWAPERWATVLVSAGEVGGVIDWEGLATSRILSGEVEIPQGFTAILAYTRSPNVLARLPSTAQIVDPAPPAGRHAAEWYAHSLVESGLPSGTAAPLCLPSEMRAEARSRIPVRDYLVVHPGSGSRAKNWPGYHDLAAQLDSALVVLRGPADDDACPELDRQPNVVIVARAWPLDLVGAVLAGATGYVGNDSGITHLAAAVGTPTLALFGPTDPGTWAPVGINVRTLQAPGSTWDGLTASHVRGAIDRLVRERITRGTRA